MESPVQSEVPFKPFALIARDLVLVPTPTAISSPSYRSFYSGLYANPSFCRMAFGDTLPAKETTDDQIRDVIQTRDIEMCWKKRGMGDFAVGLYTGSPSTGRKCVKGRLNDNVDNDVTIIEGLEFEQNFGLDGSNGLPLQSIEWVGYAGVRDATTSSLSDLLPKDTGFPPWQEMVELRYGFSEKYWGKGMARVAAGAVMQWSASELGVKRFIAETDRANARSGSVLTKMGFSLSGTDYFKEPSEVEWERIVG